MPSAYLRIKTPFFHKNSIDFFLEKINYYLETF